MKVEPILYALVCATIVILCVMTWYSGQYNGMSKIKFSKPFVTIVVTYYMSSSCQYCAMQDAFFENLTERYPNKFVINEFDVDTNRSYWEDVKNYSLKYDMGRTVVPFIIINNKAFDGFSRENNIHIENIISGRE